MKKNIVIFADGTGQYSGVLFDENRSNIYKIYRASRCAPDSTIDPAEQVAFYDPGIGTVPLGNDLFLTIWRRFYNLISQALGIGITKNIVDCYAAIIQLWSSPEDRIFLFGFSRGAYTVRCLAAVLGYCGVPMELEGVPIARDEASAKKLAKVAVRRVYQFTESRYNEDATEEQKQLLEKRQELAREFRTKYHSGDANRSNAEPHFIGVFDTVASLSNTEAVNTLTIFVVIVFLVLIAACYFFGIPLWWPLLAAGAIVVIGECANLISRIRWPSLSWIAWPPHLTERRMNFYNLHLSNNVPHARHAISVDEARASFERVRWGGSATTTDLVQKWFPGNHGDIGGGYPDNESRLSDAALKWMVTAAKRAGLKCDDRVLNFHPDSAGRQHDETQDWKFRFARKTSRPIKPRDATLDDSVVERFLYSAVQQHGRFLPYRPRQLRAHVRVRHHFRADYLIRKFGLNAAQEVDTLTSRAAQRGNLVGAFIWHKTKSEIARRST